MQITFRLNFKMEKTTKKKLAEKEHEKIKFTKMAAIT